MFEPLTTLYGKLTAESFGDAYSGFSEEAMNFINMVYQLVDDHPELKLNHYQELLEERGLLKNGFYRPEETDLSTWDLQGVLALLVAIVRQERFNDGLIKQQIEKGSVDRCLERLKELDS